MAKLNYATEYLQTLEQMFPYVLYFGDLFATPNNGRFRWVNSRVIEVPTISTTGRTDGDRDTIGTRKRNYNNEWKPLTLENHRQWQTLVHPRDIAETKGVVAIGNKVDLAVNGVYQGSGEQYQPLHKTPTMCNVFIGISCIAGFLLCGWLGLLIGALFGTVYVRQGLAGKMGNAVGAFVGCTVIQLLIMVIVVFLQLA